MLPKNDCELFPPSKKDIFHSFERLPEKDGLTLRHQFRIWDDDMNRRTVYEYEQLYTDVEFALINQRIEEWAEKERWEHDAVRQLYIADVKKDIRTKDPVIREEKPVALSISPDKSTPQICLSIAAIVTGMSSALSGFYVIEQRRVEGEEPDGWHLHFYIMSKYAPSKVKQYASQKIKSAKYTATYWATPADDNWKNKYMKGMKGDAAKDPMVAYDRILRKQLGLQEVYEF